MVSLSGRATPKVWMRTDSGSEATFSPYSTPVRPTEAPPDTRFAFLSDRES